MWIVRKYGWTLIIKVNEFILKLLHPIGLWLALANIIWLIEFLEVEKEKAKNASNVIVVVIIEVRANGLIHSLIREILADSFMRLDDMPDLGEQ